MKPILAPIKLRESSDNVAKLHAALRRLLPLLDMPDADLDEGEVQRHYAGDSTLRALAELRRRYRLAQPRELAVDQPTADLLNRLLQEKGLLAPPPKASPEFLPDNSCRVLGTVRDSQQEPVANVRVRAFDRDIRPPHQLLGQALTDSRGRYEIKYAPAQFAEADDPAWRGAELFLEVSTADRAGRRLLSTVDEYVGNAPRSYHWDLSLPAATFAGPAEFERLVSRLRPLLKTLAWAELEESATHRDLSFLSGETKLDLAVIATLALAFRLEARSKLAAEAWYGLLVEGALVRTPTAELPAQAEAVLRALPQLSLGRAGDALRRALAENRIPPSQARELDRWLSQLRELMQQQLLASSQPRAVAFQQALSLGRLSAAKKKAFAEAYLGQPAVDEAFFQGLQAKQGFRESEVQDLKASFTLAALADHNPSVLKTLGAQLGADLPRGVQALARRRPQDWLKALPATAVPAYVAGSSAAEKRQRYAELLAGNFAEAYPTAAFAGGLERDSRPALPQAAALRKFLDAHPDFELLNTAVDDFLETRADAGTRALAQDAGFVRGLKTVQRVFKLAPSYAATNALLAQGVHSARQVYEQGQAAFVSQYGARPGFSAEVARQTYQRAAQTYATTLTLAGHLISLRNADDLGATQLVPAAPPSAAMGTAARALTTSFPSLPNLFGAAEGCECDDCRSVYSPAAYFADLLNFLKGRPAATGTAKDVLFQRRPDLGWLELSCDNALTPLPYVDVVCEVLEARIAPEYRVLQLSATAGATLPGAAPAAVSALVREEFRALAGVALAADAVVEKPAAGGWLLRDAAATYRIQAGGGSFGVVELPQTLQAADELAAIPRYVNPAAYEKLRQARYPLGLPFDLFNEEVRLYAAQAGSSRAELMEVLRGAAAPNNASALAIAAEYAGFSQAELALILSKDTSNQGPFWGEASSAAALAQVANVSTLLSRSGLEYQQLQALLTLPFLNPSGAVHIVHEDASCDPRKKHLAPLSVELLDRLHRFRRLERKLGWAAWEVDMVLLHPQLGQIELAALQADEASAEVGFGNLLLSLRDLGELKKRFPGATVDQLAALFGELPTAEVFTQAYQPPRPGLYSRVFQNKKLTNPVDPELAVAAMAANPAGRVATKKGVVSAALRLKEVDFDALLGLFAPGLPADVPLSLATLSQLYRHATLARWLGLKPAEWLRWRELIAGDPFANPAALGRWLAAYDALRAGGFTADELSYLLRLDETSPAAPAEKTAQAFLGGLREALKKIEADTDPAGLSTEDLAQNAEVLTAGLRALGWAADAVAALVELLSNEQPQALKVTPAPAAGFTFPDAVPHPTVAGVLLPVSYDASQQVLSYTGIMTTAERGALLALSVDPGYQLAVGQLFDQQREQLGAALGWYRTPGFSAALRQLPAEVGLAEQLPAPLSGRLRYDAERRQLTLTGRLAAADQALLLALSAEPAFQAAVNGLKAASDAFGAAPPAAEVWVTAGVLAAWFDAPARYAPITTLQAAAARVLAYSRPQRQRAEVGQQVSQHFGGAAAVAELVLSTQHLLGADSLLDSFAQDSFGSEAERRGAYHWLARLLGLLRKTGAAYWEVGWLLEHGGASQTLDLAVPALATPIVTDEQLGRLLAYFRWQREAAADPRVTWLEMAGQLLTGGAAYTPGLFAADLLALSGWPAAEVAAFVAYSDRSFPGDYLEPATWQRLQRLMGLVDRFSASVAALRPLAAPAVGAADPARIKQLLKAGYEPEQWLAVSKTLQDSLREQKRDALTAYLLAQPAPADLPTGKWETRNDLFAYYLVDVEMGACLITSRLVQASGSVQLFVQRCLMGLEPQVRANADDDPAWKQWQWMQAYRVWEANRKVFLYPENWIQPELRRDKSPFFKELEDEILQNDITRDNVETAFLNYLSKLDGVAQLEVAGSYYEEKTNTLHVVGRTPGADPHQYYYRRWVDDARWTPWTRIEADIKSDYLLPLVLNERLYLLWPEFREEAQPAGQIPIPIPAQGSTTTSVSVVEPDKRLRVFLAISELRNGKWSPKKVSTDSVATDYGPAGDLEGLRSKFVFLPLDLTALEGSMVVFVYPSQTKSSGAYFELLGCKGYPERYQGPISFAPQLPHFKRDDNSYRFLKSYERGQGDKLTLQALGAEVDILGLTPGRFNNQLPVQPSAFDYLYFVISLWLAQQSGGDVVKQYGVPIGIGTWLPWFYADRERTFFVRPEALFLDYSAGRKPAVKKVLFYAEFRELYLKVLGALLSQDKEALQKLADEYGTTAPLTKLLFQSFYHPLTCRFAKELLNRGVAGLMSRRTQLADKGFDFKGQYQPQPIVDKKYPQEVVDFGADGSYASYNWELFYHAPLLIAGRLSANQRFEEATQWFHHIFDPTGAHDTDPRTAAPVEAPRKFWITKPFFERQGPEYEAQRIDHILRMLADDPSVPGYDPLWRQQLEKGVAWWRKNPFDPHVIAQFRTVAYQKTVVMKYLDNLIAWGDQLFRQDTMESVNQATQRYVLAAEILGPRPRRVPPARKPPSLTFNELEADFDTFSEALVDLESYVPPVSGTVEDADVAPLPHLLLYFCIPQNEQLLAYWDVVADRLYKIRHCLNIEGVARQLSLFAPPIDPAALVRATAAGLDLGAALAELSAPLPQYRFQVLLQKASEACADVRALGTALLATLEKKDGEALAVLRQDQEQQLLALARGVKQQQIEEASQTLAGLQSYREVVTLRRDYYAGKDFTNTWERLSADAAIASTAINAVIAISYSLAGGLKVLPQFIIGAAGFGGSPHATAETGGRQFGSIAEDAALTLSAIAGALDKVSGSLATQGGYVRRKEDWDFQRDTAQRELQQVERQIAGAQIRVAIAEQELENHERQLANSRQVADFLKDKYSNGELYGWLLTQTAQAFFQAYQLAHDLARKAEQCFQFELGVVNTSFVQFGHWDSLRKGLLSGERLQGDLRRLEAAYFDQNRRERELTKHVSLALLAPAALLQLRQLGRCQLSLPEAIFDLDYQGHYFRRIKTVALSIPCVAGPYTTVSCTLRLLRNTVRVSSTLAGGAYEHAHDDGVWTDDPRFRDSFTPVNAVATSGAQNDPGLFELNFRDERYLPFEGAGVISSWSLELTEPVELRQFDYASISDVLLHLRYTAREDAGLFKQKAVDYLQSLLQQAGSELPLRRLFSLRQEFATEWHHFLHPAAGQPQVLSFDLRGRFPRLADTAAGPRIYRVELLAESSLSQLGNFTLGYAPGDEEAGLRLKAYAPYGGLLRSVREYEAGSEKAPGLWRLSYLPAAGQPTPLSTAQLQNAYVLVHYALPA
jgi:hypothetical protein